MLGIKTSEGAHSSDKKSDVSLSNNSGGRLDFGGQSEHPLWTKQKDLECEVDSTEKSALLHTMAQETEYTSKLCRSCSGWSILILCPFLF